MTSPHAHRAAGPDAGYPALGRLVACQPKAFAVDVWGREPLLSRRADLPAGFEDLFGSAAVDELICARGLRTPFLRVAKDGVTAADRTFTAGGGVGAGVADQLSDDKLTRLFADGSTLVLQGLHRTWSPLTGFTQQLSAELGHPVQVNAYVTPPQSRGFDDHYDVHDVFVLQVDGEKSWRIHRPVHDAPLRDQPWTEHREEIERAARTEPLLDVVLRPGDCLYLPRGFLHAATALGAVSTHLTIGVHTWTRYALAEQLVRHALDDLAGQPAMRRSLDLGVDVADPGSTADETERVREELTAAVTRVGGPDVAERLGRAWRDSGRAAPIGPLAQLRAAETLTADDRVAVRAHVAATVRRDDDGSASLASRAGTVPLADAEVDRVRELLEDGSADVAVLGPELARRLLTAGVVVTA